jgi:hypothetical protein
MAVFHLYSEEQEVELQFLRDSLFCGKKPEFIFQKVGSAEPERF